MNPNTRVRVTERCTKRLSTGHLWVFDNEIKGIEGSYENGDIVCVADGSGRFIGKGFINDRSKITIRLLSFSDEEINRSFFKRKIETAFSHRLALGWSLDDSFRVVSSEGDLLPGLIVDKYGDILSLQFTTLGMDSLKNQIVAILKEILSPEAIIERSDIEVRTKEGLKPRKDLLYGSIKEKKILKQDGISFNIDLLEGHKTGFYLDQRENRQIIKPFVAGKKVLDCFSYTGAFALYAAHYNAEKVVAVEDSGKVISLLKDNIELNGFENKIEVIKADAFKWLREIYKKGESFGCVMLDPPSFVKSKGAREGAQRGYKDINLLGLKLLYDGGYLITSSCSQNISASEFMNILKDASVDAGCLLQIIEIRSQSRDHPIVVSMPETHYLKFIVAKKISRCK